MTNIVVLQKELSDSLDNFNKHELDYESIESLI